MNKTVNHLLAGILVLLGFSSCASLREAREARAERERAEAEAQQMAAKDALLQKMLEDDAREAALKGGQKQPVQLDTVRARDERIKLLYAVPNVPYTKINER